MLNNIEAKRSGNAIAQYLYKALRFHIRKVKRGNDPWKRKEKLTITIMWSLNAN